MGKNRSFASSGRGEIAALGEARKRGIPSDDFSLAQVLSETAKLVKVVMIKQKVTIIILSFCVI